MKRTSALSVEAYHCQWRPPRDVVVVLPHQTTNVASAARTTIANIATGAPISQSPQHRNNRNHESNTEHVRDTTKTTTKKNSTEPKKKSSAENDGEKKIETKKAGDDGARRSLTKRDHHHRPQQQKQQLPPTTTDTNRPPVGSLTPLRRWSPSPPLPAFERAAVVASPPPRVAHVLARASAYNRSGDLVAVRGSSPVRGFRPGDDRQREKEEVVNDCSSLPSSNALSTIASSRLGAEEEEEEGAKRHRIAAMSSPPEAEEKCSPTAEPVSAAPQSDNAPGSSSRCAASGGRNSNSNSRHYRESTSEEAAPTQDKAVSARAWSGVGFSGGAHDHTSALTEEEDEIPSNASTSVSSATTGASSASSETTEFRAFQECARRLAAQAQGRPQRQLAENRAPNVHQDVVQGTTTRRRQQHGLEEKEKMSTSARSSRQRMTAMAKGRGRKSAFDRNYVDEDSKEDELYEEFPALIRSVSGPAQRVPVALRRHGWTFPDDGWDVEDKDDDKKDNQDETIPTLIRVVSDPTSNGKNEAGRKHERGRLASSSKSLRRGSSMRPGILRSFPNSSDGGGSGSGSGIMRRSASARVTRASHDASDEHPMRLSRWRSLRTHDDEWRKELEKRQKRKDDEDDSAVPSSLARAVTDPSDSVRRVLALIREASVLIDGHTNKSRQRGRERRRPGAVGVSSLRGSSRGLFQKGRSSGGSIISIMRRSASVRSADISRHPSRDWPSSGESRQPLLSSRPGPSRGHFNHSWPRHGLKEREESKNEDSSAIDPPSSLARAFSDPTDHVLEGENLKSYFLGASSPSFSPRTAPRQLGVETTTKRSASASSNRSGVSSFSTTRRERISPSATVVATVATTRCAVHPTLNRDGAAKGDNASSDKMHQDNKLLSSTSATIIPASGGSPPSTGPSSSLRPPSHPPAEPSIPAHVMRQKMQEEMRRRRRLLQRRQRRRRRLTPEKEEPPVARRSFANSATTSSPSTTITPWGDVAAATIAKSSARDISAEQLKSGREAYVPRPRAGLETEGEDKMSDLTREWLCLSASSTMYSLPPGYEATSDVASGTSEGARETVVVQKKNESLHVGGQHSPRSDRDALPEQIVVNPVHSPLKQSTGINSGEEKDGEVSLVSAVSSFTGLTAPGGTAAPDTGCTSESPKSDPLDEGQKLLLQGHYKKAREKFHEAAAALSADLGPDHPLVCFAFEKLGETCSEMGLVSEAHDCLFLSLHCLQSPRPVASATGGAGDDISALSLTGESADDETGDDRRTRRMELSKARIYVRLGDVYFRSGQFAHAARYYAKSLSMRVRFLGDDHVDVFVSASRAARAHETMASLSAQGGDRDMAFFHQREALSLSVYLPRGSARARLYDGLGAMGFAIARGPLERSNVEIAKAVARLALRSEDSGDDTIADDIEGTPARFSHVETTKRLLTQTERDASIDNILPILDEVAAFHQSQNEIDLAVLCWEEKVHLLLNSDHDNNTSSIADTLCQIGCNLHKFGRHEKAIIHLTTALKMKIDIRGKEQEQVRLLHRVIASSYLVTRNYASALEHYRDFVNICIDQHKIDMLNMMGILHSKTENTKEALRCYDDAVKIEFGDTSNRDSPAFLIHNLQDTLLSPKKFPSSASSFDDALDLQDIKAVLINWGLAQLRRRHSKHAKACLREITVQLRYDNQVFEVDAAGLLESMGNMLFRRCRYREAIAFYEKHRESLGRMASVPTQSKFSVLANLATSYFKVGDKEKYARLRKEALQELGRSHKSKEWEDVATPLLNKIRVDGQTETPTPSLPLSSNGYLGFNVMNEPMRRHHVDGIQFCREGKFDAAIKVFRDILRSKAATPGKSQIDAIQLCVDISNVYILKGDVEESQKTLEAAIELAGSQTVPKHHPVIGQLRRLYCLHYPDAWKTQSGMFTLLVEQ